MGASQVKNCNSRLCFSYHLLNEMARESKILDEKSVYHISKKLTAEYFFDIARKKIPQYWGYDPFLVSNSFLSSFFLSSLYFILSKEDEQFIIKKLITIENISPGFLKQNSAVFYVSEYYSLQHVTITDLVKFRDKVEGKVE